MKRLIPLFLAVLLLTGCGLDGDTFAPTPGNSTTAVPASETVYSVETTTPTATGIPRPGISWAKAFRNNQLPDGILTVDEIAFFAPRENGAPYVVNVPKEEVLREARERTMLPRSTYYEQFMQEELLDLLPALDYAYLHGYSRFSFPSTTFSGGMINKDEGFLKRMYVVNDRYNCAEIYGLSVTELEDGENCYDYVLVTIPDLEAKGILALHREALRQAWKQVSQMPEDLDDYEKTKWIFDYLMNEVTFWNWPGDRTLTHPIYDALVQGRATYWGLPKIQYLLCNLAGVECILQQGTAFVSGENWSHIWAEAKIDGSWYLFDPGTIGFPRILSDSNFGLSDQDLQELYRADITAFDRQYDPPCPFALPPRNEKSY